MYKGTFDKNSSSSCVLLVFDKNLTFSPTDFVCDVILSLNNIQFYTLVLHEFGKNEDHKIFKSLFDFWQLTGIYISILVGIQLKISLIKYYFESLWQRKFEYRVFEFRNDVYTVL